MSDPNSTDERERDRALAEAGLMPMREYVDKWKDEEPTDTPDIVERLNSVIVTCEMDGATFKAAQDAIRRLRGEVEAVERQLKYTITLAKGLRAERDEEKARADALQAQLEKVRHWRIYNAAHDRKAWGIEDADGEQIIAPSMNKASVENILACLVASLTDEEKPK